MNKSIQTHHLLSPFQYPTMTNKYQGRVDSLQVLRQTYSDKKRAKLKDKYLIFDKDMRLPLNTPTAWVSPITKKQYDLGSLWLYLEYHLKHISNYLEMVSEHGLFSVTVSDREQVADYFLGKVKESQCIDQQLKLELATRAQKREQPVTGFDDQVDGGKKVKSEALPFEMQVIEFIYKFQRPTSSKSRSLRCPHKSFESLLKIVQNAPESSGTQSTGEKKMRINQILQRKKYPILIVPEHAMAGNINLANCEQFLRDGVYVQNAPELPSYQSKLEVEIKSRTRNITFEVTKNPAYLTPTDWENVVGVFVQGRRNEFEGWAISSPAEIFRRARGYLLRFPGKEDSFGGEWSIKTYTLDKNVRYRDAEIRKAIWTDLETFLYQRI